MVPPPGVSLSEQVVMLDGWVLATGIDADAEVALVTYQQRSDFWVYAQTQKIGKGDAGDPKLLSDNETVVVVRRYPSQVDHGLHSGVFRLWEGKWRSEEAMPGMPRMFVMGRGWWARSWGNHSGALDIQRYQEKTDLKPFPLWESIQEVVTLLSDGWEFTSDAAAWENQLLSRIAFTGDAVPDRVALFDIDRLRGSKQVWSVASPCRHCRFGYSLAGDDTLVVIGSAGDAGLHDALSPTVCKLGTGSVYLLKNPSTALYREDR